MKIRMTLFCLAILISSCATRKEKAFNYYQKNKGELAQLCNEEFPFKEEFIPGIPIIVRDTIIRESSVEIPCPDPTPENPRPTVKCPEIIIKEISKTTDTLKVESDRKIKALEHENRTLVKEIKEEREKSQKLETKNKNLIYSLIGLFLVLVFLFLKPK